LGKDDKLRIDYDTHWKAIISDLFEDFIKFFLPKAYKHIDFSHPIEFLEQELHKLIADKYNKGKVINDKLVKVKLKNGQEKWILIHIEVQSTSETGFSERMFTYFYRVYDKYEQKITAIAIYSGEKAPKNFDKFEYDFWGTHNLYKYNTYKVGEQKEKALLQSKNPFALVILASLYLLKSKSDSDKRYLFKHKLIRLAKERSFKTHQIISLLRFIDFILILPRKLEIKFEKEIIGKYIKPQDMTPRKSDRFANELCLAMYGETLAERIKKESIIEKTLIVQNLLRLEQLSVKQIADAIHENVDFVEKIKAKMEKN